VKRILITLVLLAAASGARAGTVVLQLNDVGVTGLEQMLDIARRNGNMHDAEMAVSLWNVLQAAKTQSAMSEENQARGLRDENQKLRGELDKRKEEDKQ
jgi:hypothetical protein